jgi:hypothetical protein
LFLCLILSFFLAFWTISLLSVPLIHASLTPAIFEKNDDLKENVSLLSTIPHPLA